MATNLKVTELDFDDIKDNLKAFLKTQMFLQEAKLQKKLSNI